MFQFIIRTVGKPSAWIGILLCVPENDALIEMNFKPMAYIGWLGGKTQPLLLAIEKDMHIIAISSFQSPKNLADAKKEQ